MADASFPLTRRSLIKGLGGGAIYAALPKASHGGDSVPVSLAGSRSKSLVRAESNLAVVTTTKGKLRGFQSRGIFTFKGVPYGAPTGGRQRFHPPVEVEPWSGIRSAMSYGPICPQASRHRYFNHDETAFILSPRYDRTDEDCLRLNIWTSGLESAGRRPVMVWLHGGGCTAWSAQFLECFNGEQLSRTQDVVVVGVNHRLGPLGFLNLAELASPEFSASGNAGTLDLVSALTWIRAEIMNFGGDPTNVTLFGQSGGGSKIGALLAMPSAKGLFHKAIVISGTTRGTTSAHNATQVATGIMGRLGINPENASSLQSVPVESLLTAADLALNELAPSSPSLGGFSPRPWEHGWGPVVDGLILPEFPFADGAPACSADVPLMIGTVGNECMPAFFSEELETLSMKGLHDRLAPACGEQTQTLIDAYRDTYPHVKPVELMSIIYSTYVRRTAVSWSEHKARQKSAATYSYWFRWRTPILDGRPRSFHCLDLPFIFNNVVENASMTGGGPDAEHLSTQVADSVGHFARTGDPDHRGISHWPAFNQTDGPVMIFDTHSEVQKDPDKTLRSLFATVVGQNPSLAI